jgi:uncharacterized membrane-anchored protein
MKPTILTNDQRKAGFIAGIAIVVMTIGAMLANDVTIGKLLVEGDPTGTLENILGSKLTFDFGILCWIIILVCDVVAAWGLYLFFRPINRDLSLLAAWFRLIYVAMLAVAIFNLVYAHMLIHQETPPSPGTAAQLGRDVMFYIDAFNTTWALSLVVFGIHILLIGMMALKSGSALKVFGIILIIAFAGYTIPNVSNLLLPEYKDAMKIVQWIFLFPMLGEVALGVWLVVKGIRKIKHL